MSDIKYESTKPLEEFKVVKEAKMRKTSGDLISREDAFIAIHKVRRHYIDDDGFDGLCYVLLSDVRQKLKELPSAEREVEKYEEKK